MINENIIKIQYLKNVLRQPSETEITDLLTKHPTIETEEDVEIFIKNTNEYKHMNSTFYGDITYDMNSNIISMSNINQNSFLEGVILGNNTVGIQTSSQYNKLKESYIYNNNIKYDSFNFTDLRFSIDHDTSFSKHVQQLNLNDCKLNDSFMIGSNLYISIDKRCLQNQESVFFQTISLSNSDTKSLSNISITHCFEDFNSEMTFETNTVDLDNNIKYLSYISNETIELANLYKTNTNWIHKGYNILDNTIYNSFHINELKTNETADFSILTILKEKSDTKLNLNSTLFNLGRIESSIIIDTHEKHWNNLWETNFELELKDMINNDSKELWNMFHKDIKLALFNLYNNHHNEDNIFFLPVLNILRPHESKKMLTKLIELNNVHNKLGDKYFTKLVSKKDYYGASYIYDSALLAISIWNYFRVSKDRGWLESIGYQVMTNISDYICSQFNETNINNVVTKNERIENNNIMTKYFCLLALKYTINATSHFQYVQNSKWEELYQMIISSLSSSIIQNNDELDVNVPLIDPTNGASEFTYTIRVTVEKIENTLCYVFYGENNERIGHEFGGTSGRKMGLYGNCTYTFVYDNIVKNEFPIEIFNDSGYIRLDSGESFKVKDSPYTSYIIKTFSFKNKKNSFNSVYKSYFNNNYGKDAFKLVYDNTSINEIKSIVQHSDLIPSNLEFIESFVVLSAYYNNEFIYRFTDNNNKLKDILEDTLMFYKNNSKHNSINNSLISTIYGNLSQLEESYLKKKTLIQSFTHFIKNIQHNSGWGISKNNSQLLFSLTSLFGLCIEGEQTKDGFYISEYGLKNETKNVLPFQWKSLTLKNIGSSKTKLKMNNVMYFDNPMHISMNGIKFEYIIDEINYICYIDVKTDDIIIPSEMSKYKFEIERSNIIPQSTDYKASAITVDNSNLQIQINYQDFFSQLDHSRYKIVGSTTSSTLNIDPDDNDQSIDFIRNNIFIFSLSNLTSSEYYELEKTVLYPYDTTSTIINPTVYTYYNNSNNSNIQFELSLFTQNQSVFETINGFHLELDFGNALINPTLDETTNNNISDKIETSNIYLNALSSNLILDYTFTDPISGILDIGLLNFELNQDYAHDLRRYGQIYGTTTIGTKHVKPMYFYNSNYYPPTVYTNLAYEFIHASNDYKLNYEDTKYVQVNQLYKSESISNIEMDSNISTFLSENSNLILFNAMSSSEHNVFRFLNTDIDPKTIEYYCIGSNNSNILMQTDPIDSNIVELTKCEYLETFCTDTNIDINKISLITNDECSILYTDTSVYGIGKNEFNIFGLSNTSYGLYDTITSEFVESYQMSNLLSEESSTIKKLVLNDKSLLAYLNTNKVYGLGSNEMFRYITKSNIEVEPTLSNITELEVLNNFITERDYEFLRIEGGKEHFKFMVAPKRFETVGGDVEITSGTNNTGSIVGGGGGTTNISIVELSESKSFASDVDLSDSTHGYHFSKPYDYPKSNPDDPNYNIGTGYFSGATTIKLHEDDYSYFQKNDHIMIIQMQGETTAGQYEFNKITTKDDNNTVTLESALLNDYTYINENTAERYQVLRVPIYNEINIEDGATITTQAWDGVTGGVLCLAASNINMNGGTIDMSGKGYRGGYNYRSNLEPSWAHDGSSWKEPPQNDIAGSFGVVGEGYAGIYLSEHSTDWFDEADHDKFSFTSNQEHRVFSSNYNFSGGAGGYIDKYIFNSLSAPNHEYIGTNDVKGGYGGKSIYENGKLIMGGGGGTGGQYVGVKAKQTAKDKILKAGDGGGIIVFIANTIYVSNNKTINIKANGEDGSNVGTPYYGGHGGGAGGNIAYYTNEIVNDANLENLVDGGSGSDAVPGEYTNYATNGTNGESGYDKINRSTSLFKILNNIYDTLTVSSFLDLWEVNIISYSRPYDYPKRNMSHFEINDQGEIVHKYDVSDPDDHDDIVKTRNAGGAIYNTSPGPTPITGYKKGDTVIKLHLDDHTNFNIGDTILIIQMQGELTYGQHELRTIINKTIVENDQNIVTEVNVELDRPIENNYTYVDEDTAERYQVVRVPVYESIFIEDGGEITTKAWDGSTGGILYLSANTITVNGTINMIGKGYRGGHINRGHINGGWVSPGARMAGHSGMVGEGYFGKYLSIYSSDFFEKVHGSGIFGYNHTSTQHYMFSTSANYGGGNGGGGGVTQDSGTSRGVGGTHTYWKDSQNDWFNKYTLGGGGGTAGLHDYTGIWNAGNGGGSIILEASVINGNGNLYSNGGDENENKNPGSGGGAGGSIILITDTTNIDSTNTSVNGGQGDSGVGADGVFKLIQSTSNGTIQEQDLIIDSTVTFGEYNFNSVTGEYSTTGTTTSTGNTNQGGSTSVPVYVEPFKTERALVLRGDEEWWGIGHNIHNCMCVSELYTDNVFRRMIRLRDLESLIHGINFDPAYTGITLVEPRKYHVFSHNGGIMSTSTFVLDTVNKNVYMMGALNDEEIYTKWIQWLEESDYMQDNYPYYFTQTNNGIYIGYNNDEQTYTSISEL